MSNKGKLVIDDTIAEKKECFVIMPISDHDGYCSGHFKRVYEDIFVPAIKDAGFIPYRADEDGSSNLIQLSILRKLIDSPMAICDLSTRNPNVMFELGIRQAFDKPVALVQEEGTPKIFDISQFRYVEYKKDRLYHEVLENQKTITKLIKSTYAERLDPKAVNSIIRLLELTNPAKFDNTKENELDPSTQFILQELQSLRSEIYNNVRKHPDELYNSTTYYSPSELKKIHERFIYLSDEARNFIGKQEPLPKTLAYALTDLQKELKDIFCRTNLTKIGYYADSIEQILMSQSNLKKPRAIG